MCVCLDGRFSSWTWASQYQHVSILDFNGTKDDGDISVQFDRRIPDDWKSSILLPVFKEKEDPMEYGSYRVIKLLEDAMKLIECVFE